MRFLARNAGQTAAEYLGVLLVVSVVIAAIASSAIGIDIARRVSELVCEIGGGSDCGAHAREAVRPQVRDYENQHGDRQVFDANDGSDVPGERVRVNGDGPTGDPEADAAHDNFGRIYDYYMDNFGRDSYDDNGAPLIATIDYRRNPDKPFRNAYWDPNRRQMVFGDGYAAPLDVTAHEVTHAITERSAGLVYEGESGALNESMSDIFGSNLDPDDWEIGEDLPGGAIRNMADPKAHGQPGHVNDYLDTDADHGGVHTNSGIPNRAYVNMVDSIGRDAAQHIVYTALTEHLESDSGFEDFRTASLQAAEDRYGRDSSQYRGVNEAFAAVGLDGTWEAPR